MGSEFGVTQDYTCLVEIIKLLLNCSLDMPPELENFYSVAEGEDEGVIPLKRLDFILSVYNEFKTIVKQFDIDFLNKVKQMGETENWQEQLSGKQVSQEMKLVHANVRRRYEDDGEHFYRHLNNCRKHLKDYGKCKIKAKEVDAHITAASPMTNCVFMRKIDSHILCKFRLVPQGPMPLKTSGF